MRNEITFPQLERLNKTLVDWGVNYSVYPYNAYTMNELLMQFFNSINGCVDVVNEHSKTVSAILTWVQNEGLSETLTKQLIIWKEDGTFNEIINKELFKGLSDRIDGLNENILDVRDDMSDEMDKYKETVNEEITIFGDKINEFKDTLDKQKFVTVYLNEYGKYANEGTEEEDWSKAFDYVFKNVVKDSVATIKWNGRLKVRSTIFLPKHVNLEGTGLPWSGLTPTADFQGDYVIKDLNVPTHNSISKLYFDFAYNKNVRGLKVLCPYDYTVYDLLVADGIGDTFLDIGGSEISQSLCISNCVAYRENRGTGAIMELRNCQEFYIVNNKFLYKSQGKHECVWCDGVTNTTFINNSFAFTDETALKLLAYNYPKRLTGNLVIGNLFEGIGAKGCINLIGSSNPDLEGSYNTIEDNSYFSSTPIVTLGYIANTKICDPVKVNYTEGTRRTYFFNKYNANSKNPYGNVEEYTDGGYKMTKAWFKILPVDDGGASYLYMTSPDGTEHEITVTNEGELKIVREG